MVRKLFLSGRRGQLLIVSALVTVVMVAMLALSVDIGQIAVEKARLQNAADSAVLAATRVLADERIAGEAEVTCRAQARIAGTAIFQANTPDARVLLEFGTRDESGHFVPVAEDTAATAVRASAFRDSTAPGAELPLFFAPFFGVDSSRVETQAIARVSYKITGVYEGLSPFAVPKDHVPGIGGEMIFYPANSDEYNQGLGLDSVAPGCWGLLNLDGGDLSTTELLEWIANGYNGGIELGPEDNSVWINGTTGFRAAMNKPLQDVRGRTFIMSVYDQVVGNGSNGSFRIVGFLLATITDAKLVGNNPYVKCRVADIKTLHGVKVGPGDDSLNINKVELVY